MHDQGPHVALDEHAPVTGAGEGGAAIEAAKDALADGADIDAMEVHECLGESQIRNSKYEIRNKCKFKEEKSKTHELRVPMSYSKHAAQASDTEGRNPSVPGSAWDGTA